MSTLARLTPRVALTAVGIGLVLVGAGVIYNQSAASDVPQSRDLTIAASPIFDFGMGKSGDIIRHRFTLKNPFDDPLRIASVASSCGCTVLPDERPREIAPGSVCELPVMVKLPHQRGEFQSTVVILFERHLSVRLRVRGLVVLPGT